MPVLPSLFRPRATRLSVSRRVVSCCMGSIMAVSLCPSAALAQNAEALEGGADLQVDTVFAANSESPTRAADDVAPFGYELTRIKTGVHHFRGEHGVAYVDRPVFHEGLAMA